MKQFTKFLSVLLTICFLIQGFPVFAAEEASADDTGDYLYYNSFDENMDGLTLDPGYTTDDVRLTTTEDGVSVLRVLRTLNEGETDASWGGDRFYMTTSVKPKEGFPKLVFEFRYRVNTTLGYQYGRMQDKTPMYNPYSPTVAVYDNEVWSDINKNAKIADAPNGEWHTVTIIYDNESANRVIKVDNNPPVTVEGNNYFSQKAFQFHWAGYLRSNAEIDYDYFKIFEVPETFTVEILNGRAAEMDRIALEFNTPLDMTAATVDKFQLDGSTVTGIIPDPENSLRYYLELATPLEPETEYNLHINNLENIYGLSLTEKLTFRTRSLLQYAKSIDITASTEEQITVTSTFVNEKEAFNPVLAAAFYRADGSMRSFATQTNAVGLISQENSQASAFSNQFAIPADAEATDVVELYYLRGENVWEPISGKSVYTANGKQESEFNPVIAPYEGTCTVAVTPNPETEELTLLADTGEEDNQREIHFAVYTVPKPGDEEPEALVYARNTKTEAGVASTTFKMADADGQYRVSVFVRGAVQAEKDAFFTFYSKTILDGELQKVNESDDPAVIESFIQNYGEACNLNLEVFSTLADAGKQQAYKSLLALRDERTGGVFASTAELNESLQIAVLMGCLFEGKDVETLLAENRTVLGLDETAVSLYEETLSEEAVKAVVQSLSGKEFLLPAAVAETFSERVVLDGISKAQSYIQVRPIIEKMDDVIGLSLTTYNTLKNPEKVCMALSGETYSSYSALKSAFDSEVEKQKEAEEGKGGGGTGSSGTGSGGTGGGFRPPEGTFEQTPAPTPTVKPEKQFTDMEGYEWAQTAVTTLVDKEIVTGKTEDTFAPGDEVTRAEFLKMVVGAFRLPDKSDENPFYDVAETDWYYEYILNGFHNGIVSGLEEDQFGPEEKVTREMAATMIYRAFEAIDATLVNERNDFIDAESISDYAKEAVSRLCGHNILNGFEDQTFRPSAVCSRAEAAQMIYAAMGLFE